jgi:hypothetical protein
METHVSYFLFISHQEGNRITGSPIPTSSEMNSTQMQRTRAMSTKRSIRGCTPHLCAGKMTL